MASRKPKNIVSPWLGASKNIMVAGKTSASNMGSSEAQIDTGGGERDKVNETLMLGVAGAAGVTAATLGARATGLPQRLANTLKGKTVGLHGSPTPGLKSIDPRISRTDVDVPTVSYMRTDIPPSSRATNVDITQGYAGAQGSIYVVKADKGTSNLQSFKKYERATKNPPKINAEGRPLIPLPPTTYTKTTTSAKVFAEIPVNKFPTEAQLRAEVARQTRLAGSSMRTQSLRDKVEEKTRQLAMKKRNKKSVM